MNIIQWDISLFEWINNDLSSASLDLMMPWIREPYFWLPLYVFIIAFTFLNYGLKGYWFVLFLVLTAGSADLISSRPIKKAIKRLRPCNTEYVHVIERVQCGSGYSFTSSHAANHFAVATFLVLTLGQVFRKVKIWLWIWAGSVAFAQVYVGVHFPLDVIGGALLGIILGKFWSFVYLKYYSNIFQHKLLIL
jgi:undecaprenyl-diphosphatase